MEKRVMKFEVLLLRHLGLQDTLFLRELKSTQESEMVCGVEPCCRKQISVWLSGTQDIHRVSPRGRWVRWVGKSLWLAVAWAPLAPRAMACHRSIPFPAAFHQSNSNFCRQRGGGVAKAAAVTPPPSAAKSALPRIQSYFN